MMEYKLINLKLVLTAVFLYTAVFSFSQTKEDFYKSINEYETNQVSIFKDNKVIDRDKFLLEARSYPIYKIDVSNNRISYSKVDNSNFIVYDNSIYFYKDGYSSRRIGNDVFDNYLKINSDSIKIGYLTDNFYLSGKELSPIIINLKNNVVVDYKKESANIVDYINYKYGLFEKYNEIKEIDSLRNNLKLKDCDIFIKNNYQAFEYNCPKDTTLVLRTLMNQIKNATNNFSKEQENELLEKIKIKTNPFDYMQKTIFKNSKETLSLIEKNKTDEKEFKSKIIKFKGAYNFYIYDSNITNELLEVLTNKQFNEYKKYIDIYYPVIGKSNVFKTSRLEHVIEILVKEKVLKSVSSIEYKKYTDKILLDCGCPFDETIKRELIIR